MNWRRENLASRIVDHCADEPSENEQPIGYDREKEAGPALRRIGDVASRVHRPPDDEDDPQNRRPGLARVPREQEQRRQEDDQLLDGVLLNSETSLEIQISRISEDITRMIRVFLLPGVKTVPYIDARVYIGARLYSHAHVYGLSTNCI